MSHMEVVLAFEAFSKIQACFLLSTDRSQQRVLSTLFTDYLVEQCKILVLSKEASFLKE